MPISDHTLPVADESIQEREDFNINLIKSLAEGALEKIREGKLADACWLLERLLMELDRATN